MVRIERSSCFRDTHRMLSVVATIFTQYAEHELSRAIATGARQRRFLMGLKGGWRNPEGLHNLVKASPIPASEIDSAMPQTQGPSSVLHRGQATSLMRFGTPVEKA